MAKIGTGRNKDKVFVVINEAVNRYKDIDGLYLCIMELVKARNDFCHRNDLDGPPVTIDIALSNSNICDVIDRFRADLDRYESLDQSYSPIVAAVKLDKRGKNMLNPKIVELYGEGSRKPLENLINLLGDKASAVYIVGHCGCRYVNGVKMPNVVTTEQSQVSFVEQCVRKLYDDWGGGADDETIEAWSETEKKGNIPLCVAVDEVQTAEKVTSGLFNAAALMGGD